MGRKFLAMRWAITPEHLELQPGDLKLDYDPNMNAFVFHISRETESRSDLLTSFERLNIELQTALKRASE